MTSKPRFQGAEAVADMALISLERAHQFLVAAGDPALRPLVIGTQRRIRFCSWERHTTVIARPLLHSAGL
jgi:hypothetical protein